MTKYFLDTDVCIDIIRRRRPASRTWLTERSEGQVAIPSVVVGELFYGVSKRKAAYAVTPSVQEFLAPFEIVAFDAVAAEHYGFIRGYLELKGEVIGPNDLLIAATALAHRATLITGNKREFLRVPSLRVASVGD